MSPIIENLGENSEKNKLTFEIRNVDVCVVNSIRRTILSNITTLVFRGFPHNENNINIIKNTSKFNNEYLKHRISCIPIMNDDSTSFNNFRENYKVVIDVENNSSEIMYVTTNDIKIVNKLSNNEISKDEKKKLFPPSKIITDSEEYILICVLYPNHNTIVNGEALHFEANFDIGSAKENSCWNVVSNCMYENIKNEVEIANMKKNMSDSQKRDFELLDSQKIYLPNEYKFTVETLGIFSNTQIIHKACSYIISKLNLILDYIKKNDSTNVSNNGSSVSSTNISNNGSSASSANISNNGSLASLDILSKNELNQTLKNGSLSKNTIEYYDNLYCLLYKEDEFYIFEIKEDDYTIGKLIEKFLYNSNDSELEFVGFKKEHPTTFNAKIYIKYKEKVTSQFVFIHLMNVVTNLISLYKEIQSQFKN